MEIYQVQIQIRKNVEPQFALATSSFSSMAVDTKYRSFSTKELAEKFSEKVRDALKTLVVLVGAGSLPELTVTVVPITVVDNESEI